MPSSGVSVQRPGRQGALPCRRPTRSWRCRRVCCDWRTTACSCGTAPRVVGRRSPCSRSASSRPPGTHELRIFCDRLGTSVDRAEVDLTTRGLSELGLVELTRHAVSPAEPWPAGAAPDGDEAEPVDDAVHEPTLFEDLPGGVGPNLRVLSYHREGQGLSTGSDHGRPPGGLDAAAAGSGVGGAGVGAHRLRLPTRPNLPTSPTRLACRTRRA